MSAMATTSSSHANPAGGPSSSRQYVFTQEIARMAYVHCQLTDPDESTLRHIEDLVRGQLVEVVLQARAQAARRGSRQLAVEDLLFLIRHDKPKLGRIRAYLSSRSAHQKYSENGEADDDRELDAWGFQIDHSGTDEVLQVGQVEVGLPWELDDQFGARSAEQGDQHNSPEGVQQQNQERLNALDLITRGMTKEEYMRYTDSRQATFVGRKSSAPKKFRDFLSMSHLLDGPPTDDVLDVFAFLAYELVGTFCAAGIHHRRQTATGKAKAAARDHRIRLATKRKAEAEAAHPPADLGAFKTSPGQPAKSPAKPTGPAPAKANGSPKKARTREQSAAHAAEEGAAKSPPSHSRALVPPTSLFSEPLVSEAKAGLGAGGSSPSGGGGRGGESERPTLLLDDLHSGFFGLQQGGNELKMGGGGMRNWRAGANRRRGMGAPLV